MANVRFVYGIVTQSREMQWPMHALIRYMRYTALTGLEQYAHIMKIINAGERLDCALHLSFHFKRIIIHIKLALQRWEVN